MSTTLSQNEDQQKIRPAGVCIVSTPKGTSGVGGYFYKKWTE
jgi:hypothetical protein